MSAFLGRNWTGFVATPRKKSPFLTLRGFPIRHQYTKHHLATLKKELQKKRLVFEDSIDTASDNGGSQSVDIKNEEMLGNLLDDTLQELAKQEIEKLMPEDSQKKCLKIYLLHKALVAVTPTLLREFSSCLALQSNLYYQGIRTNPFCEDLLNFLTSRTEENEQKLLSHNHSLVLPKSL